jgi:hypothetical protein
MRSFEAVSGAVVMLLDAGASACPNCATTRLVQTSVQDGHFGARLAAIVAPIVVLVVIAALLRRLGRSDRGAP